MSDQVPGTGGDEPECGECLGVVRRQRVGGKLFAYKLAVGDILVQGVDDVIAVGPRIGAAFVFVVAMGVAVVDDIKPVPRPAFAVARRREEAVDELFIGIGRRVVDKRVDFLGRGGEAVEIEG